MRRGFTGSRGFRWTRLVWSVLAAFALLLGLAGPANAEDGSWDPTLPPVISAGAPGDPVAIANQSLQATASATQSTLDLGKQFLGGLGINPANGVNVLPGAAGTPGTAVTRTAPAVPEAT